MIRLYDLPKPKLGEETWLRCKDVGPHPRYPSSLPIRTLTIGVLPALRTTGRAPRPS